ncbi:MAG: C_GCAxxG_C_C family protein [Dorea sp.]|nr:C_GCAxxG_C_C family protein [Dorea sp.]
METKQIAEEFMKGYDCSQVVLKYFAHRLGISEDEANRVAAGFGGGMMLGSVCGAYTGALMALGLKYGHTNPDGLMKQKEIMLAKMGQLNEKFTEEFSTVECKELIGYDLSVPEELKNALDSGKLLSYCPGLLDKVIQITEQILDGEA